MSAGLFIILCFSSFRSLLPENRPELCCSQCVCADNSARLIISHNYISAEGDREEVGGGRRELLIW